MSGLNKIARSIEVESEVGICFDVPNKPRAAKLKVDEGSCEPQDEVARAVQRSRSLPGCRAERDLANKVLLSEYLLHEGPNTMDVLVTDLHEDRT